jgi:hypothetical protein
MKTYQFVRTKCWDALQVLQSIAGLPHGESSSIAAAGKIHLRSKEQGRNADLNNKSGDICLPQMSKIQFDEIVCLLKETTSLNLIDENFVFDSIRTANELFDFSSVV